jgi:hypothetical protein
MEIFICTKENPWDPKEVVGPDRRVRHLDAHETDWDSEWTIEYRCPHCGIVFSTEMPD